MIRYVGLDVHKPFVQACVVDEQGRTLLTQRVDTTHAALTAFAQQLLRPSDHVALEATTNCWAVRRILVMAKLLRAFVDQVAVSNPLQTKAIAQAKIKTDKVDAHALAQLLRCDYLPTVWMPDETTQTLRTLTHHRAALVAERTRLKNRPERRDLRCAPTSTRCSINCCERSTSTCSAKKDASCCAAWTCRKRSAR